MGQSTISIHDQEHNMQVHNLKGAKARTNDTGDCLPALPLEFALSCEGGPTAMLQAAVFSDDGSILTAVGFLGYGSPLSTGSTGQIRWPITIKDVGHARPARLKWRTIVTAGAADLHSYTVNLVVLDDGEVVWKRSLNRQIPEGQDSEAFEMSIEFC